MRFAALLLSWLACAIGCGPSGDGEIVSCSCAVTFVYKGGSAIVTGAPIDIELCKSDFSTDPTMEAQTDCVTIENAASGGNINNTCACQCVHTATPCHTK